MGYARLSIYIVGLLLVVAAAWIFLTQTPIADEIPTGVAMAIILLLVGLGVMVSASAMNDTFVSRRRVSHDTGYVPPATTYVPPGGTAYVPPSSGETVVEERRF